MTGSSATERLASLFAEAESADYVGEPVSQAEHALQAASLAQSSGDASLVLAALLHDVGHLCFPDAERMGNVGVLRHEALGADFLTALGFSRRVAELVEGHVDAKRYLVATNANYAAKLSDASRTTLDYQGGAMTDAEVRAFEARADADDLLRLRAWDEAAKVPGRPVPAFEDYRELIEADLSARRLADTDVAAFHETGYLHLTDVFSPAQVARLQAAAGRLAALPETPGAAMKYFERGGGDERQLCRVEDFLAYEPVLGKLIDGPLLLNWLGQLMGEPACLFKEKVNFKLPGGAGFEPHQDAPAFTSFGQDYHITVMLSFDATTTANGCLELVSGRWDETLPLTGELTIDAATVDSLAWQPLPTAPGDIVLFHSYLPHRSGANDTTRARRALYATYNRASQGDVRDDYFAAKRKAFPPDVEREPGREYDAGVFNVGNPIGR